jgi:serine/threonine-protein kinase
MALDDHTLISTDTGRTQVSSEPSADAPATIVENPSMALAESHSAPLAIPLALTGAPDLEIRRLLGAGGMGQVYLAYEPALDREVALKELGADLAEEEQYRQSFVREARSAARLHHPGIVPIHALTLGPNGSLAFTMQAIAGVNLREWMERPEHRVGSQRRIEQGLEMFIKLCDTLAYAHSRGVLHCDVKPENVMVGEYGSIYLMDWGLARPVLHEPPQGTSGTPAYMAPEQARNESLDVRSDVFGLGAILFELVTGDGPYGRGSSVDCHARARAGRIEDIFGNAQALKSSRRLCGIVKRALAPARDDRYSTVSALRDDVHTFLRAGSHLPRLTFAAGTLIVKEGDRGDAAYLIVSGRCRVVRMAADPEAPARILEPGEIFGELALLLDAPRTASIEALEECTVLVIDRETLEATGAMDGWMAALIRALARRFRDLERRLDASGGVPSSGTLVDRPSSCGRGQ